MKSRSKKREARLGDGQGLISTMLSDLSYSARSEDDRLVECIKVVNFTRKNFIIYSYCYYLLNWDCPPIVSYL